MDVQKIPNAPFYIFFGIMRLTGDFKRNSKKNSDFFKICPHAGTVENNTLYFEVFLLFLSLRYGADLGRSRLVILSGKFSLYSEFIMFINLSIYLCANVFYIPPTDNGGGKS